MTLEKKIKKWNKNPTRHLYLINARLNVRYTDMFGGYDCESYQSTCSAYNKEHALYQFISLCRENHKHIHFEDDGFIKTEFLSIKEIA